MSGPPPIAAVVIQVDRVGHGHPFVGLATPTKWIECTDPGAIPTALLKSLPPSILTSLASLIRSMNCYYSNLIEGHDTHPIDIERALKNDYSSDAKKRDLQLEAKAHITVQQWIDKGGLKGHTLTADTIRE